MRPMFCFCVSLWVAASSAVAGQDGVAQPLLAPPTLIRLASTLLTPGGQPRSGTVRLVLSIYEREDDTTPLWLEQQFVTLNAAGGYEVLVGATMDGGLPLDLFAGGQARWLGIAVEDETEQPRIRLLTVPYAATAANAAALNGRSSADFVLGEHLGERVRDVLREPDIADVLGSVASGSADVGVAATANAIPRFLDGAGTLDDSTIFNPGGLVGIGTAAPSRLLDVNGDARLGASAGGALLVRTTGATSAVLRPAVSNGSLLIGDDSEQATRGITIANGGLIGVGTATPTAKLHVEGAARATGNLTADGNLGAGTSTPAHRLEVNGSARLGSSSEGAVLAKSTGASSAVLRPAVSNGSLLISDDSELATRGITMANGGFVGIGTDTPSARLHVAGGARITGDVTVDGNIGARWQDVAEWVEASEPLAAGTVVVVDPERDDGVVRSQKAYDARVAGAVSPQPGVILGVPGPTKVMVAQSGRVRVKVDARYGSIKRGDLLVTSPRAGYAMRSNPIRVGSASIHRPGTVLGKALEALPTGTGEILVLLTLQ